MEQIATCTMQVIPNSLKLQWSTHRLHLSQVVGSNMPSQMSPTDFPQQDDILSVHSPSASATIPQANAARTAHKRQDTTAAA